MIDERSRIEKRKQSADLKELSEQRLLPVVESNTFIRETCSDLSVREMKVLYTLFSQIPKNAKTLEPIIMPIGFFLDIMGLSHGGRSYSLLKENLLSISTKRWWVTSTSIDGKHTKDSLMGYIDNVEIIDRSIAKITFSSCLSPFLLELKESFTTFPAEQILSLRNNKYFIELFRYLSSISYLGEVYVTVDELKRIIGLTGYDQFRDFRNKILKPAIKEINLYSYIEVSFTEIKKGRNVEKIIFYFYKKDPVERLEAHKACMDKLGYPKDKGKLQLG